MISTLDDERETGVEESVANNNNNNNNGDGLVEDGNWCPLASLALLAAVDKEEDVINAIHDDDDDDEEEHDQTTRGNHPSSQPKQRMPRIHKNSQPSVRRDWGIPTFHDQIDRGIKTFQLQLLEGDDGEGKEADSDDEWPKKQPMNSTVVEEDGEWNCSFTEQIRKSVPVANKVVTIHLEHRLHSTGSDVWDSALVLAHALPRVLPVALQPQLWSQHDTNNNNNKAAKSTMVLSPLSSSTSSTATASNRSVQNATLADAADPFHHLSVLELGSGTGAVGLFCAKCMGMNHVILTDQRDNLALIRKNCHANQIGTRMMTNTDEGIVVATSKESNNNNNNNTNKTYIVDDDDNRGRCSSTSSDSQVAVCELDWTNPILPSQIVAAIESNGLDLIVGSDLFLPFAPDLLLHLADRIAQILTLCLGAHRAHQPTSTQYQLRVSYTPDNIPNTTISDKNNNNNNNSTATSPCTVPVAILAYEERFDCSIFFQYAQSLGLHVEEIDRTWLHPKYQDPERIHVLRITLVTR